MKKKIRFAVNKRAKNYTNKISPRVPPAKHNKRIIYLQESRVELQDFIPERRQIKLLLVISAVFILYSFQNEGKLRNSWKNNSEENNDRKFSALKKKKK